MTHLCLNMQRPIHFTAKARVSDLFATNSEELLLYKMTKSQ